MELHFIIRNHDSCSQFHILLNELLMNLHLYLEYCLSLKLTIFYYLFHSEYVIAFLGSIEAGLVVTTVNPSYTSEEISRQLISCKPKILFCLTDNVDVVRRACTIAKQPDIKVIAIQAQEDRHCPSNTISFTELINTQSKVSQDKIIENILHLLIEA